MMKTTKKPVMQSPNYWDCECNSNYIRSKSEATCELCKADQNEQPDSRVDEVEQMLNNTTQADTVTDENRIIAEFMGYKLARCSSGLAWESPCKLAVDDKFKIHGRLWRERV